MSRVESSVRIVLAFQEAFNRHDIEELNQLVDEEFVFDNYSPPPDGKAYSGREVINEYWHAFFREFPNVHLEIEEIFGLGERCIMRWKCSWIEAGENDRYLRGIDLFKVRDGSIHERLSYVKG
jgi:ketosteroid isomerase-like protein